MTLILFREDLDIFVSFVLEPLLVLTLRDLIIPSMREHPQLIPHLQSKTLPISLPHGVIVLIVCAPVAAA